MRIQFRFFVILMFGMFVRNAFCHNLDNKMTFLTFDQETLTRIETRALNNEQLLQADDIIGVVLKTTPGVGEPLGAGGYMTFYIPEGTQVVDGFYGYPDGTGEIQRLPMKGAAEISTGIGGQAVGDTDGLIGLDLGPNVLGVTEATVTGAGTPCGTLAGVYADTGFFYSTDIRTTYGSWEAPPTGLDRAGYPVILTNNEGDVVTPVTMWDGSQLMAYGVSSETELVDNTGRGNSPWGLANVVAGPESGYAWDFNLADWDLAGQPGVGDSGLTNAVDQFGPWNRIMYPGSQVSFDVAGSQDGEADRGFAGVDGSTLGASFPLSPTIDYTTANTPNAIRVGFGSLEVGRTEYAVLKLKLLESPSLANDCFEMFADAFGGDAAGIYNGKDHLWRYYDPTLVSVDLCSSFIQKVASKQVAEVGSTFDYTIKYITLTGMALTGVVIDDTLPPEVSFVSYSGAYTRSGTTWTVGNVASGEVVTITFTVEADAAAEFGALNEVCVTNTQNEDACAEERTIIGDQVVLLADKTVDDDCATPGGTVEYTITISNRGSADSDPITIREFLPAGFSYGSVTSYVLNGTQLFPGTNPHVSASATNTPIFIVGGVQGENTVELTFTANVPANIQPGSYLNSFEYQEASGQTFTTGFLAPVTAEYGSISGALFNDWNGNGNADAVDNGLSGISVALFESGQPTAVGTAVTDGNGEYIFDGLEDGVYTVLVLSAPAGYTLTADPEGALDEQAAVTLTLVDCAGSVADIDFGYQPGGIGTIGDQVFEDIVNLGVFDPGSDAVISNVTVTLFTDIDGDGIVDPEDYEIGTTVSDVDGKYLFSGLAEGLDYLVRVDVADPDLAGHFIPNTFNNTTAVLQPVSNLTGNYLDADFGFRSIPPGSIGDQVFRDNDFDNLYTAGDVPLADITVTLYVDQNGDGLLDGGDTVFSNTVTDVNGQYLFTTLPPGDYIVDVDQIDPDLPGGLVSTIDEIPVELSEGQDFLDADFPFILLIDKTVDLASAEIGDVLTFTITPQYPGVGSVSNLVVLDDVPAGTTYVGASANAAGVHDAGTPGALTWSLGSTAPAVTGTYGVPNLATAVTTFFASKDAYIDEKNSTTNYGGGDDLKMKIKNNEDKRGLIEFDLSSLTAAGVSSVISAELRLFTNSDKDKTVNIHEVSSAWAEGSITWDNAPAYAGAVAGTISDEGGKNQTRSSSPLSSLVDSWLTGSNNGLALVTASGDETKFRTKEWNSGSNPPELVVEYSLPPTHFTTNQLETQTRLVTVSKTIELTMTLVSTEDVLGVTVPVLSVVTTGTAGAVPNGGSTPAGPINLTAGTPSTITWQYDVTSGSSMGSVTFSGTPGSVGNVFAEATAASILTTPLLTFGASVNGPIASVSPVDNVASMEDDTGNVPTTDRSGLSFPEPSLTLPRQRMETGTTSLPICLRVTILSNLRHPPITCSRTRIRAGTMRSTAIPTLTQGLPT